MGGRFSLGFCLGFACGLIGALVWVFLEIEPDEMDTPM